MLIRPFVEDDYAEIARLHNETYSDFAKYVDELRYRDSHCPEGFRWGRWIALDSDKHAVGFAQYHNNLGTFHSQRFGLDFAVDSHASWQDVSAGLYETVMQAVEPLQPLSLASWARADMAWLTSFLTQRGFEPTSEMFTSTLDLQSFDAARWRSSVATVERDGVRLCSLEELGGDNPVVQHRLYDLWCEVREDVPIPEGEVRSEPLSFDLYWQQMTAGPALMPAGFFIATHDREFVGMSQLWRSPLDDMLRTGLTAVRRAYRRRGIALALKVRALSYAQGLGYRRVVTTTPR